MTFLPIVDRELRVRARWRSTYVVRAAIAVLAISVTIVMLFFAAIGNPGSVGKTMLAVLAWLAFGFCVIDGFRSTADCLSEEKREGTLGLLFLTDLRGFDVVLGKFAATSLSSFYGVLAIIPALAITVLLGGVTGAEFWRVVLALLNTLFFSLTAGMFVSAISRDERKAWAGTVALVAIPVVLFPILHESMQSRFPGMLSPTTGLVYAFAGSYNTAPGEYWQSIGVVNVVSWLWLLAASLLLPRVWQDTGTQRRRAATISDTPKRRERRAALLAANPIWWLTARHDRRTWLWVFVSVVIAIAIGVFAFGEGDASVAWGLYVGAVLLHFAINVWVASEACYSFADARSSGAMELLLSTPLSVRQIVTGQQLAIKDFFFRPMLLLVIVEGALMIAQIVILIGADNAPMKAVGVFILVGFSIAWFVLDLFAVSRVGMWFGLTSAKPTHALTKTVLYVLVLPLLITPCCSIVSGGLMLAKSVIFLTWAQSKLDNEFRAAATRRFESQRGEWWKRKEPPRLALPPG